MFQMFVIMAFSFSLKLLISFVSEVDFNSFKALTAPKPILTLGTGNNLASRLKSCFISILIEFFSPPGWANLCSNDTTISFIFHTKETDKSLCLKKDQSWFSNSL